MRVGMGYDVHKLVEGRPLILGGVEIPHTLGLLGHSDADVLVHAIMDALLGAAALGDIGKHFPDTDPQYSDCTEAKAASVYCADGGENCKDPWHCKGADQYQGNDRGRTWVYRNRRRNFVTGNLYVERIL